MDRFVNWLKNKWANFYVGPVDPRFETSAKLIVVAYVLFILLLCARCVGGIAGL